VRVIEERGRFVVPGLWDMHVHFRDPSRNLKMDIANGVLGIRNMGGAPKDAFPLREAIAGGVRRIGPKIFACGSIVDGPDS
jgi:cytosine/adenosine deaminase-related metal-dependent hydrolase